MDRVPTELLDLAALAHACVVAGYSQAAIARAAGLPEIVPRRQGMTVDEVVELRAHRNRLTHPDDIAYDREHVHEIARLLGIVDSR